MEGRAKSGRRTLRALFVAIAVAAQLPLIAAAKPARIVSLSTCTDQLVLLLADRDRIASLSYMVDDRESSAMAGDAPEIVRNHGIAEEIVSLEPDLVVASAFATRATASLLRRLGYEVSEIGIATTLAEVRENVRRVAEALGEVERGAQLIADFDARIARSRPPAGAPRPLAALYWANGYTAGTGTLADEVVEAAGFRSLGRALGFRGTAFLPLETLLASRPDVLILGRDRGGEALAEDVLRHPALRRAFADRPVATLPDALWVCGTPFVAEAVGRLADVRSRIVPR